MDEVKFLSEGPLIFGIIDFEAAIWRDARGVNKTRYMLTLVSGFTVEYLQCWLHRT